MGRKDELALEVNNLAHILFQDFEAAVVILLVLDDSLELEVLRLYFVHERLLKVFLFVLFEVGPHIRHHLLYVAYLRQRILGIHEIALVELHHEVLTERPLNERVVDEYLVVARRKEASKHEPILTLDDAAFEIGQVHWLDVRQLILEAHIVDHIGPARHRIRYFQMLQQVSNVSLEELQYATLDGAYLAIFVHQVLALHDRQQRE